MKRRDFIFLLFPPIQKLLFFLPIDRILFHYPSVGLIKEFLFLWVSTVFFLSIHLSVFFLFLYSRGCVCVQQWFSLSFTFEMYKSNAFAGAVVSPSSRDDLCFIWVSKTQFLICVYVCTFQTCVFYRRTVERCTLNVYTFVS